MNEQNILEALYQRASELSDPPNLGKQYNRYCGIIMENQQNNRGVLAVLTTLVVKKMSSPEQDIRKHRAEWDGGFSGRGLDEKVVTPFLREHKFPFMASGTGWLTRSLEQSHPYDLEYPGRITPEEVKDAFLGLVNGVQCKNLSAEDLLLAMFVGLIRFRHQNINVTPLQTRGGLSVAQTLSQIVQHYDMGGRGVSRLPVLAIHAVLRIMARETERYDNCRILPLESHTTSDKRADRIGDIVIVDSEGDLFEGYEIKHNIPVTSDMIRTSYEKFKTTPVKRFYILTTHRHDDYAEFNSDIERVATEHGCQLVVNGVDRTLLYYLRLVNDVNEFVEEYASSFRDDQSVTLRLKKGWNDIVRKQRAIEGEDG